MTEVRALSHEVTPAFEAMTLKRGMRRSSILVSANSDSE